jgi:IPT/TIG domain
MTDVPVDPIKTGEGPGSSYVRALGISIVVPYLVLITSLALYSIVKLWSHPTLSGLPSQTPATQQKPNDNSVPKPTADDIKARQDSLCGSKDAKCGECVMREMQLQYESQLRNDPQCTYLFGCHFLFWQEERLLLLVFLAGAVGALLHAIRSLVAYVGNRNFVTSWLAFYYLAPFAGAALGFVGYIVIRGGFFSSTATTSDANPFMFVALAALSGLFSQQVLEKLKKVAESAFDKPAQAKDALHEAKPVITAITPDKVKLNFEGLVKVDGTGFVSGSVVRTGGKAAEMSDVSEKQLTFKLPAELTARLGKIEIIVQNPAPGGRTSEPKTVDVVPDDDAPVPPPPARD